MEKKRNIKNTTNKNKHATKLFAKINTKLNSNLSLAKKPTKKNKPARNTKKNRLANKKYLRETPKHILDIKIDNLSGFVYPSFFSCLRNDCVIVSSTS